MSLKHQQTHNLSLLLFFPGPGNNQDPVFVCFELSYTVYFCHLPSSRCIRTWRNILCFRSRCLIWLFLNLAYEALDCSIILLSQQSQFWSALNLTGCSCFFWRAGSVSSMVSLNISSKPKRCNILHSIRPYQCWKCTAFFSERTLSTLLCLAWPVHLSEKLGSNSLTNPKLYSWSSWEIMSMRCAL